ncbi:MAG: ATP-binding protein [Bacteroidales bacterium]
MIHLRKTYIDKITEALKLVPIVVLIGARQVGKTTIMKNLPLNKVCVFLDAQDPEVAERFKKKSLIENYLKIHINPELNGFLLIDEFQYIDNISVFLKLLVDHNPNLKIICSGSSGINVIQNVKESMAGRVRMINVYSLSLSEYLMFKDKALSDIFSKYDLNTEYENIEPEIKQFLNEYLIYGGMPRLALTDNTEQKAELLEDIYKTYLLRDVRSFIRNEDFVGFNKLLRLLASQAGNMVNINNLSKECSLSYKKTEEYLYIIEQMYIIQLIEPFHSNRKKVITKMRKVFFTDTGLRNIILGNMNALEKRTDKGELTENFVLLEIRRKLLNHYKVYYYRTLDGSEVDFIVDNMKKLIPVEVKHSAFNRIKNLKNLNAFIETHKTDNPYVVNKNLNMVNNNTHFIPYVLAEKLKF